MKCIIEKGYKFLLSPNIVSYHHARNTFKGMIKQKFENGRWIGITMKYCPKCFSMYHFIPMLFVLGIIFSIIMTIIQIPFFLYSLIILYSLFNIINLVNIFKTEKFNFMYFTFSIWNWNCNRFIASSVLL